MVYRFVFRPKETMQKFDEMDVTTITAIVSLNGTVNIELLFSLLPIYRDPTLDVRNDRKKVTIPYPGLPGKILSAKLGDVVRGIYKKGRPFRNSIMMDISTNYGGHGKNVNLKLTTKSVHMCGPTSKSMVEDVVNHLLDSIKYCQYVIDNMDENPSLTESTVQWVLDNTKGEELFHEGKNINRVKIPKEYYEGYPFGVDPTIADFLLELAPDYAVYSHYELQVKWAIKYKSLYEGDLSVRKIKTSMVNYNFSIGFPIDRKKLCRLFDGRDGFESRYFNATDHAVTIYLPYTIPDNLKGEIRKRGERRRHSFLVYVSGNVTQSGPHIDMNREAYNKFYDIISENIENIRSY